MGRLDAMRNGHIWGKHSEGAAAIEEVPPVDKEDEEPGESSDESTNSSESSTSTEGPPEATKDEKKLAAARPCIVAARGILVHIRRPQQDTMSGITDTPLYNNLPFIIGYASDRNTTTELVFNTTQQHVKTGRCPDCLKVAAKDSIDGNVGH